jgi:hypothetical protein
MALPVSKFEKVTLPVALTSSTWTPVAGNVWVASSWNVKRCAGMVSDSASGAAWGGTA